MLGKKLVKTTGLSKEEWLEYRKVGIGGSEIGALMGVNKYSSPLKVFLDKLGLVEEREQRESAYWGNQLEPLVADELVIRLLQDEFVTAKINKVNYLIQHPDHPVAIANIDREIRTDVDDGVGILECKTANQYALGEWESNEIPESYICQINWYMGICGYTWGYLAVLVGGQRFLYKKIQFNQKLFDEMVSTAEYFWENYVSTNTPPPVSGIDTDEEITAALTNFFGVEVGVVSEIYAPKTDEEESELTNLLMERYNISEIINVLEEEKKRIGNELKMRILNCEKAVIGDWKISNKTKFLVTKPKNLSGNEFTLVGSKQEASKRVINLKEVTA